MFVIPSVILIISFVIPSVILKTQSITDGITMSVPLLDIV